MKKMRSKNLVISLIVLFIAALSNAADLPKLPLDPSVAKGVLPNGMSFYIVSNPTSKGMADFALVQRTGRMTSSDIQAVEVAKDVLADVPMIGYGISPQKFFSSNGVSPGPDGFVRVDDNSTIYRFSDVLLSQKASLLDSALVVMVGMADKLAKSQNESKWYSTSDNAIIISGDVDSKSVISKLSILSYLTPVSSSQPRDEYAWVGKDKPSYEIRKTSSALSEVRVMWTAPRVPNKYVGTLQPYIQKMYMAQLGEIAVARIKSAFHQMELPYASVTHRHTSSSDVQGDERFMLKVVVAAEHMNAAVEVIAQTMSALESSGAGKEELEISRKRYVNKLAAQISKPVRNNSDFIDLCSNAFLFGIPVVDKQSVMKAYTSYSMEMEKQQQLFKDVADALIDPRSNLTMVFTTSKDCTVSELQHLFETAWEKGKGQEAPASIVRSDTLSAVLSPVKVGLKPAKKDYTSGGQVWTFSNGFKVVYKKMDTSGQLYWSMCLGGGFGSIADLQKGEGAFVGDLLGLYEIAGMKGSDFKHFLELNNIDMSVRVGLASSFIKGVAHKDNLRLLLRSLVAVANERQPDRRAYAEYMKNEQIRLQAAVGTREERKAVMDSLMCPDYNYSQIKSRGKLSDSLADKADRFYEDRFSAMNDGVLVLVGDIDESVLKKELLAQVGFFRTRKSAFYRPTVGYQPVSGSSTYTVDGKENTVYITLSVPLALSTENKMASEIAAKVLKKSLSAAIESTGMTIDVSSNTAIYPQERFNVMITLKEASEDGFATGVEHSGALEALSILRVALRSLEKTEVTDGVMKAYKEWLKNDITYRMKSPQYWLNAIAMRHMEGKDFSTDYKARIDAVTTEKVKQILTSLNNASKVEYIIRK